MIYIVYVVHFQCWYMIPWHKQPWIKTLFPCVNPSNHLGKNIFALQRECKLHTEHFFIYKIE